MPLSGRAPPAKKIFDRGGDLQRLSHAPEPALAGLRHLAFVGADQRDAVGHELREIALRCFVRPHMRVHRRRQQNFRAGREQHGGGEIVGVTARHLGHQVGGRRCNDDEIGFAREANVADVEFARGIEQIGEHALADNGAGRQRRDEMLGRLGENAAHGEAALLQPADEIERLVGGDAAADDQQHALGAGGCAGRAARRRRFAGRREILEDVFAGLLGGRAQNGAHLILDRAAAFGRAQAQQLLEALVELPDGEGSHEQFALFPRP